MILRSSREGFRFLYGLIDIIFLFCTSAYLICSRRSSTTSQSISVSRSKPCNGHLFLLRLQEEQDLDAFLIPQSWGQAVPAGNKDFTSCTSRPVLLLAAWAQCSSCGKVVLKAISEMWLTGDSFEGRSSCIRSTRKYFFLSWALLK